MVNINLRQVGDIFKKDTPKGKELQEEELDDIDASEFEDDEVLPKKTKSRRPREDAFTQQRIAAFNPIYTPRTVLPVYLIIAAVFVLVGGCLLAASNRVDQFTIFYHDCMTAAPTDNFGAMDDDHYDFYFHKHKKFNVAPKWRYVDDPSDDFTEQRGTCQVRFTIPDDIKKTVFINYILEKYVVNHRRYVLSFSEDQIRGKRASYSTIHDTPGINCKELARNEEGKLYYPCGLIANTMFNDSFPFELTSVSNPGTTFALTNKNINWHSDKQRFKKTKYHYSEIVPPPFWTRMFPEGYNETNVPNIEEWEEFQNWMRSAAFDKQIKLIRRNDNDTLPAGEWQIDIGLHWPINLVDGKKGIYVTHGSSLGGKNSFLGSVYLIGGCICAAMALVLMLAWLMARRKVGDPSLLSWNREDYVMVEQ